MPEERIAADELATHRDLGPMQKSAPAGGGGPVGAAWCARPKPVATEYGRSGGEPTAANQDTSSPLAVKRLFLLEGGVVSGNCGRASSAPATSRSRGSV